jgi:hypothetical protein
MAAEPSAPDRRLAAVAESALDRLAREVRSHHEQAESHWRSAVEHAWHCGQRLVEAKELCRHGEWLPWLREVGIPQRTANTYTRLAAKVADPANLPPTISEALDALDPEARARRARLKRMADQFGAAVSGRPVRLGGPTRPYVPQGLDPRWHLDGALADGRRLLNHTQAMGELPALSERDLDLALKGRKREARRILAGLREAVDSLEALVAEVKAEAEAVPEEEAS